MKKQYAPPPVQTQCKPGAYTDARPANRGTDAPIEYVPYKEVSSHFMQPHTPPSQLAPVALTVAREVLVLVLKVATLGLLKTNAALDSAVQMQAKRRRWRQLRAEAAADDYGRGVQVPSTTCTTRPRQYGSGTTIVNNITIINQTDK